MLDLKYAIAVLGLTLISIVSPSMSQAAMVDHVYVKSALETRFGLKPKDIGMTTTYIQSKDCTIRILDGSGSAKGTPDQAALQVMKNGTTLTFFVSDRISYDLVRGSLLDLTATKKSGFVSHAVVLKISALKLSITNLSLYPSDDETPEQKTSSLNCQLLANHKMPAPTDFAKPLACRRR